MEVRVLGVGNAFTARYYNTCFLVRSERSYLVDCPQGLFRLLHERGIDPADLGDVLVTHIHGDHTSGLETLVLWKKYTQRRRIRLHTSRKVYDELCTRVFPRFADTFTPDLQAIVPTRFDDYVDFMELSDQGRTRLDEHLEVEIRENWHPTPTLGLKLRSPRGTIGISGDTCYRPRLLRTLFERGILDGVRYERLAGDWLWSADLVYHEVDKGEASAHTLESDLLALPDTVRSRLRLIHLSDDFDGGELAVAREGEVVTFPEAGKPKIDVSEL